MLSRYIFFIKFHLKITPADKNTILLLSHISRVKDQLLFTHAFISKREAVWASSCMHAHAAVSHVSVMCRGVNMKKAEWFLEALNY